MMRGANGNGSVVVCSGVAGSTQLAFGLLNNFVGGSFDELWGNPYVAVWQGFDTVYQIIAPAFNPSGLSAAFSAAGAGAPVALYAGPDGRLACSGATGTLPNGTTYTFSPNSSNQVIAYLLDFPTNGYIVIQLKI
jgi:hypothetical protein